ncbi:hypothetical protein CPB83DRAFT_849130 [Crepidotus variabilis]|uniref:Uncharacterized protein n=1 Tax=Crepidotus variabilis TaxID=179855 RepID=A0A9P6JT54_9AGAR|nr:hypothetical protein CPB83DRAFT_849130 [Crepidotus variabilis]
MSRSSLPSTNSTGRSSQSTQLRAIAHKLPSAQRTVPIYREEINSTQAPSARYPSASVSTTSELDFLVDTSEAPPAYTEEPLSMEQGPNIQLASSALNARRRQPPRRVPVLCASDSDSDSDAEKKKDKKTEKQAKSTSKKENPLSSRGASTLDYPSSACVVDSQGNVNSATARGTSADQGNNYRAKQPRSKRSAPVPLSPGFAPAMYGYGYHPMHSPMGYVPEGIPMSGYGYQPSASTSSPRTASRKGSKKPQRRPTDPSSSSTNSSSDSSDSSNSSSESSSDSDEDHHVRVKMGKKAVKKACKQSKAVRRSVQPQQSFPYQGMQGSMMMPGMPMHAGSLPISGFALSQQISANVNAELRRALGNF